MGISIIPMHNLDKNLSRGDTKTPFHQRIHHSKPLQLVHKISAALQQYNCLAGFLSSGMLSGLSLDVCMHTILMQTQHDWQ